MTPAETANHLLLEARTAWGNASLLIKGQAAPVLVPLLDLLSLQNQRIRELEEKVNSWQS